MIMKIGTALHRIAYREKGFTLIELIVVIAVLGVLAVLVIPRVVGVGDDAEGKVKAVNKKLLINALERYYAKEGKYPKTSELESKLVPNYLDEIPSQWTSKYNCTDGTIYTISD
jgi:general secretion pathway protein G